MASPTSLVILLLCVVWACAEYQLEGKPTDDEADNHLQTYLNSNPQLLSELERLPNVDDKRLHKSMLWQGMGKRAMHSSMYLQGLGKRGYGSGMFYQGLGKRNLGLPKRIHSSMYFQGIGKRLHSSLFYSGMGKRPFEGPENDDEAFNEYKRKAKAGSLYLTGLGRKDLDEALAELQQDELNKRRVKSNLYLTGIGRRELDELLGLPYEKRLSKSMLMYGLGKRSTDEIPRSKEAPLTTTDQSEHKKRKRRSILDGEDANALDNALYLSSLGSDADDYANFIAQKRLSDAMFLQGMGKRSSMFLQGLGRRADKNFNGLPGYFRDTSKRGRPIDLRRAMGSSKLTLAGIGKRKGYKALGSKLDKEEAEEGDKRDLFNIPGLKRDDFLLPGLGKRDSDSAYENTEGQGNSS